MCTEVLQKWVDFQFLLQNMYRMCTESSINHRIGKEYISMYRIQYRILVSGSC
jgi:hypothetical protein